MLTGNDYGNNKGNGMIVIKGPLNNLMAAVWLV